MDSKQWGAEAQARRPSDRQLQGSFEGFTGNPNNLLTAQAGPSFARGSHDMSTVKEWPIRRTLITKTNARVSYNSVEVCLRVCLLHPKPAGCTCELQVCSPLGRRHLPRVAMFRPVNKSQKMLAFVQVRGSGRWPGLLKVTQGSPNCPRDKFLELILN